MRSRQHCYRFGSNRIGLGNVVSRGMDDGPMLKDHPDIEMFWMPNERIQGPAVAIGAGGWVEGDAGRFSSGCYRSFAVATILSWNKTCYCRWAVDEWFMPNV